MFDIQGAIGKLPSKLHKNENSTDLSLYQIYLQKLHENIWKYYRLNLSKITIGFNHKFHMTSEPFASLSNCLLIYIGKSCHYPCL